MLETRAHEWLSRLQGNGPWLVSLALATLIAVELARIAVGLLGSGPVRSPRPILTTMPPPSLPSGFDVQKVVASHLLGIAGVQPGDPIHPQPSRANLVLAGTIATSDPKRGVAIISDGGPSKVYGV